MSKQPYMQLWVADFLGDTLHLSDAEIGQYMLILMAMWRNGGYLPNDPAKLSRVARNTVSDEVMAFFEVDESSGSICQKRLLAELAKAQAKSEVRSEAGKAGAKAKALKNKKPDKAIAKANATAKAQANGQHSPEPESVSSNEDTPRNILEAILDSDRAKAVIEHRAKIRKPLTVHAARLLGAKFARCPDPNAAADEMIANGWQGFEPEWLQNRANGANGPPLKPGTEAFDRAKREAERRGNWDEHYRLKALEDRAHTP